MIRASPEILAVARRWFKAISEPGDQRLADFMTGSDFLRYVGTAEGERWSGPAVRDAVDAHFSELPAVLQSEEVLSEAYESDALGWAFFVKRYWFATRSEPIDLSCTLIFTLEKGSWKIVLRHASFPADNTETLGTTHTVMDALVAAAQKEFSLEQQEGVASIMFTDIVDSTLLAAALGDQSWTTVIRPHLAMLRRIIEEHGGQFVKSLGDGTMSSFPSARAALSAARAIQSQMAEQRSEPILKLRIGMHTGDVVQSQDDFFGSVVNKAARLTALASAGEIHVSDVTRAMVGTSPDFSFSDGSATRLRGFEGTHMAYRLNWQS